MYTIYTVYTIVYVRKYIFLKIYTEIYMLYELQNGRFSKRKSQINISAMENFKN